MFLKDGKLLEAVGEIDELMAVVAIVGEKKDIKEIEKIIKNLSEIGAYLTGFKKEINLEIEDKRQGMGNKFLIPGKEMDVWWNWARTVARRVERRVVALNREQEIDKSVLDYLNRLSSYIFSISRV